MIEQKNEGEIIESSQEFQRIIQETNDCFEKINKTNPINFPDTILEEIIAFNECLKKIGLYFFSKGISMTREQLKESLKKIKKRML